MPFTEDVWRAISIVVFIYWGTVYLTTKIEKHYEKKVEKKTIFPVFESAMTVLAAAAQQGEFNIL